MDITLFRVNTCFCLCFVKYNPIERRFNKSSNIGECSLVRFVCNLDRSESKLNFLLIFCIESSIKFSRDGFCS